MVSHFNINTEVLIRGFCLYEPLKSVEQQVRLNNLLEALSAFSLSVHAISGYIDYSSTFFSLNLRTFMHQMILISAVYILHVGNSISIVLSI